MSVINRVVHGSIKKCISVGVPIIRINSCKYPYCIDRCRPYENTADPLSCSWSGGQRKRNLINFKWNLQRTIIFSNENFGDIFSPRYNRNSAIEILTKSTVCSNKVEPVKVRIEYSFGFIKCPTPGSNNFLSSYDIVDESTTPFQFNLLVDSQNNRKLNYRLSARLWPEPCAQKKYKISMSADSRITRRPSNICGSSTPLSPEHGEVLWSIPITFVRGNPPKGYPPLTFPLTF